MGNEGTGRGGGTGAGQTSEAALLQPLLMPWQARWRAAAQQCEPGRHHCGTDGSAGGSTWLAAPGLCMPHCRAPGNLEELRMEVRWRGGRSAAVQALAGGTAGGWGATPTVASCTGQAQGNQTEEAPLHRRALPPAAASCITDEAAVEGQTERGCRRRVIRRVMLN